MRRRPLVPRVCGQQKSQARKSGLQQAPVTAGIKKLECHQQHCHFTSYDCHCYLLVARVLDRVWIGMGGAGAKGWVPGRGALEQEAAGRVSLERKRVREPREWLILCLETGGRGASHAAWQETRNRELSMEPGASLHP